MFPKQRTDVGSIPAAISNAVLSQPKSVNILFRPTFETLQLPSLNHSGEKPVKLRFRQFRRFGPLVFPTVNGGKADSEFAGQILLTQGQMLSDFLYKFGKILFIHCHSESLYGQPKRFCFQEETSSVFLAVGAPVSAERMESKISRARIGNADP